MKKKDIAGTGHMVKNDDIRIFIILFYYIIYYYIIIYYALLQILLYILLTKSTKKIFIFALKIINRGNMNGINVTQN